MSPLDLLKRPGAVRTEELGAYLAESRGLERDFLREVLRSRRNAWRVAIAAAVFGFASLMTLTLQIEESSKPVPPFILRVDNTTGQTDVVSVMKTRQDSYGDVVDRYWLSQYTMHRESYDYQTIQADYNATGLMSAPDVAAEYRHVFEGDNARDKILGDRGRILVEMESPPVLNPGTSTASARFTTVLHWKNNRPDEVRHWIATIAYSYVQSPMKPQDRLINPLGFQVQSYRVDPELAR
ncbi:virB8 family protein [Paraburkholderia ultramafica]|uniref:virB8 family protein n=1 Tax=Paraburkholderia ultramafica TaxID=1544867 RepID=UPI001C2E1B68|nr:type IV secretion system protein [Paraburkholderia ultramafica]